MLNYMEWLWTAIHSQALKEFADFSLDPDGQVKELCLGREKSLIVCGVEFVRSCTSYSTRPRPAARLALFKGASSVPSHLSRSFSQPFPYRSLGC